MAGSTINTGKMMGCILTGASVLKKKSVENSVEQENKQKEMIENNDKIYKHYIYYGKPWDLDMFHGKPMYF